MPDLDIEKAASFEEFESEMLAKPGIRREYEALIPKYDRISSLLRV